MSKTATSKLTKEEQLAKDKKRAEELILAYNDLKWEEDQILKQYNSEATPLAEEHEKKLAPIRTKYNDQLSPVKVYLKEAEKELLEIGERQKKTMFKDGNWKFDDVPHYLHIKKTTKELLGDAFNLSKFVKKFNDYVDVKFKFKELKAAFSDGDQRKKFTAMDFDLQQEEEVELKTSKAE